MRVTSSMYYKSMYGSNNSKITQKLFDVNKQIASGLKIQYAGDDVPTFTETMRLDNEITTLGQIKKSTESGYKISNQSDVVLNEFETSLNRVRTLLISASNGTNDSTSLDAIASELRGMQEHFISLGNTSINGQYLFSGSAIDVKPIDADGNYNGNDVGMNAFLGSRTKQQYNLTGAKLFHGEESSIRKEITTNVVNKNVIVSHPELKSNGDTNTEATLKESNTIRDLMGDTDDVIDDVNEKHFFYIRGTTSNGKAVNTKISLKDSDKIQELLTQIGNAYGNTSNSKVVNVEMTLSGQIVIKDRMQGSSKLDFHIVGATDFSGGGAADVTDIDDLDGAETNFSEIINPTNPPAKDLYVKEFVKSNLTSADGAASNIDALVYDRTEFIKDGSKVTSNASQIVKDSNAYATASTKLSEVADLSQGGAGTLAGTQLVMSGKDSSGQSVNVTIDLQSNVAPSSGSKFSVNGQTYKIFDLSEQRGAANADDVTYQQLMDVMNIVTTGELPNPAGTDKNTDGTSMSEAQEYDKAVYDSKFRGETTLNNKGQIEYKEFNTTTTKASIALYDSNSGKFSDYPTTNASSALTFNTNNALSVRDPKTDFFGTLDKIITAVESYTNYPDASSPNVRNVGLENSIAMLDDLQDHIFRAHSIVGAQSNTLTIASERIDLLEVSTKSLRSSVIDTDLAESSLALTQLNTNYKAMLSTVSKVSQLSLVNYL